MIATIDWMHVIVAAISIGTTYLAMRNGGTAPATPGTPVSGPTALDMALDVLAARHPALKPLVALLEKAEHDGELEKLKAVLFPPAPPAPAAAPPK